MQPITFNQAATPVPPSSGREHQRRAIRAACEEFEGFFLGTMLKEGLKPMLNDSTDAPPGKEAAMHLAIEHTAREMGRQGSVGMADLLYEQLTALL